MLRKSGSFGTIFQEPKPSKKRHRQWLMKRLHGIQTDDNLTPVALPHVEIYTDGGCEPNPGPGGYGVVLMHPKKRTEASGGFRLTTNNRMEIYAAIAGLEMLKQPCNVTLYAHVVINGGANVPRSDVGDRLALRSFGDVGFNPEGVRHCEEIENPPLHEPKAKDPPLTPALSPSEGEREVHGEEREKTRAA